MHAQGDGGGQITYEYQWEIYPVYSFIQHTKKG